MAQGDRADDNDAETEGANHAGASDAQLTELLSAATPTAYPALQELRGRHRPSVLAYARLCTTSESVARQLAAQAFTLAAREAARGADPGIPWRHQLLLLTGRVAASWAADQRAAGLDAGFLLVLNTAGPDGPVPPMLAAFQSLPSRAQGLIWYGCVEREPEDRTAALLGLTREDVTYGTEPALQSLGQACLRSRLAASDDPRCADFRRLIEESVRPDNSRHSADLNAHMAHCPHCTAAYEELSALRDDPRSALAEGLLPWAGTAYTRTGASDVQPGTRGTWPLTRNTTGPRTRNDAGPRTRKATGPRTKAGTWPPSRRFVLASAALGVALAPLLLIMLFSGDSPSQDAAGSVSTPAIPPSVTVTATATVSSTPSASPSSSKSPSPTKSYSPPPSKPAPPKPTPTRSPTYPVYPPGAAYAQVVNVASGRCLDIRDGVMEKGTDVITAPCTSSATQRWRVDAYLGVLQSYADSDFCLDSRGSADEGVGIWECDSIEGRNAENLRFTVDDDGVIRPEVATETSVTPDDSGGLSLLPLNGGTGQRWRAGAT
ncbi:MULTISPECIES: RICIN domain-containing protein [Streptomyces]|uniref:Ricin-type beta-trefoil lectin domain protein n=1 Tax=Streptomyces dengpaensis TaxID=2049881 RepID=A0ABN5I5I4_9ACTN|nr:MULTISPECIES: RICIN domain-containing protein [Streptomyces]AVH58307.1 ricin-type beta-trefoil lectin domain protein [Streptomyces dengpaensis]PIB08005.1 ricin-type beta-trefoil lectin domain protein [Streptomyces sp. HG99]